MMIAAKALFWGSFFVLFYTYLGYGLIVALWLKGRVWIRGKRKAPALRDDGEEWPAVTLLVAAYNEESVLEAKIRNCRELDYPPGKLKLLFVTDGSDDGGPALIRRHADIRLLHRPERQGKVAALKRAMPLVDTPVTVFTDANTFLNPAAIRELAAHFRDARVGAVAGEKHIRGQASGAASTAGEGLYWKYESWLKRQDAELHSVVGAAGELYAIRTALFQDVPEDTLLDDFMQALLIARAGYRVAYAPGARAEEYASANLREELKRKVRICAGGAQSILRLRALLNPFRFGVLSFQYVSHRVLRWTLAPLALPLFFAANLALAWAGPLFFQYVLFAQFLFYGLAVMGYLFKGRSVPVPGFFAPLYFCLMNYSAYAGFLRFFLGAQGVDWEKARRAEAGVAASQGAGAR